MEYLLTFTTKINQMKVNIPYMDPMGEGKVENQHVFFSMKIDSVPKGQDDFHFQPSWKSQRFSVTFAEVPIQFSEVFFWKAPSNH